MTAPWQVIRIAYFQPDKGRLILEAVVPLIEVLHTELGVGRLFFRSHWKFGPHVDLVVAADLTRFEEVIFPAAASRLAPWLAHNPSTVQLDPVAYAELSKRLALFELERGPYGPLLVDNSVTATRFDDQAEVLGDASMARVREDFLVSTTPYVIRLVATRVADLEAAIVELAVMLGFVGTLYADQGLGGGYMSFRSHAEYFFANHDPKGLARAKFAEADEAVGPQIDAHIARFAALTDVDELIAAEPAFERWIRLIADTHRRVGEAILASPQSFLGENRLEALSDEIVSSLGVDLDPNQARKSSEFEVSAPNLAALFRDPKFNTYKTVVNFTYSLLPIIGLSPMQKFLTCHLVANASERAHKVEWKEIHARERVRISQAVSQ